MYFNVKNTPAVLLTVIFFVFLSLNFYSQTNVCAGSTSQLSYSGTGGTWSSSNTGVATVNSTGLVTGVSAGSSTVSYQSNSSTNTSLYWNFDNTPTQSGSILTYNPTTTSNSSLLSGNYTTTGSAQAVNPFSTWGNSVKQTDFGPNYSYIEFTTTATTTNLSSMVFQVWHNHNSGQAGTGNYDVRLQISSFNGVSWSAWSNIGNVFTWSSASTAAPSPNTGHNISLTGNSVPAGTHRIRWFKVSGSTSTNGDGYIMNTVTFNCQSVVSSTTYSTNLNVTAPATAPTSISGISNICPGNSVVLTANGGSGSVYQWGTGSVGTNIISGATSSTYTATPSATTTYWVRRVQQSPCTGFTDGVTFAVTVASTNSSTNLIVSNGDYIWQGGSSTNLKTAANWIVFTSPNNYAIASNDISSTKNVFIPKLSTCVNNSFPVLNQPVITSSNTSVRDITILENAILTVDDEDLDVFGNWVNNGTFNHANVDKKVDFKHASALQTIGGTSETEFYNLEISENNSNNVVLSKNTIIKNNFKFGDNRKFELGDFNIVFLGNSTISSESNLRYFVTNGIGTVKRILNGSTQKEFPVGISTYNPCLLNNTGTSDQFSVRVIENVTNDGTGIGLTTAAPVVKRTWMVDELISGGSVVDMSLYWNGSSEEINGFDQASLFVAHHDGNNWENIGVTSNSTTPLFIKKDDISSFSPFTIGSLGGSPLPVELTSFTASCEEGKGVFVKWSTASEHNSSYFDVLKSEDGHNWRSITVVSAAGNSVNHIDYSVVDAEKMNGTVYYKLMQYDIDGKLKEYGPISSSCNLLNEMVVKTFPNPSSQEFYVEIISPESTTTVISIVDAHGKTVYSRTVDTDKGVNLYSFEDLNILPGMYYIQISNDLTTPNVVKHSFR